MNYNDISEIRESANAYVIDIGNAVSHNMADPVAISASAKRLHDAIITFDFKELPRVLDGISARSLLVRPGLPDIVNMAKKLQSFCGAYRTKIKAYDPDVLQVALFCNEFVPLMEGAIEKLKERVKNEPTEEDIQSAEIIHDYFSGLYPDKTFSEVLHGCVFLAADDRTLQRRGKYLAAVFNGVSHDGLPVSDEIMSYAARQLEKRAALGSIKDLVMKDEAKKKAASTTTPASTPEPQPTLTSGNADDVTPPDTSTIMELMLLDDEEQKQRLLATLHKLVDGKKGKHVALVFLVCEKCGLMNKPTHQILTLVFGDIGTKSGYNKYYSKGLVVYTQEQIKGIETHILPFVNGH